jgi:hypothetical protein
VCVLVYVYILSTVCTTEAQHEDNYVGESVIIRSTDTYFISIKIENL